jgi:hypothetical protein
LHRATSSLPISIVVIMLLPLSVVVMANLF